MEICVKEESKVAEIWLTHADQENAALQEQLKPLYARFKESKYLVAVFYSGRQELFQQTRELLSFNKKRIAELEVKREGNRMSTLKRQGNG